MQKRYELTAESKTVAGVTVFRIRRLSDSLLGGFIESEKNLAQHDEAWVFGEACVFGKARVYGEACVDK